MADNNYQLRILDFFNGTFLTEDCRITQLIVTKEDQPMVTTSNYVVDTIKAYKYNNFDLMNMERNDVALQIPIKESTS